MWGNGSDGRLGLGNTTSYSSPVKVGSLTNWSKVYCADKSTIVKKTDGTAWAFGINDTGQLGLGNLTAYSSPVQIGTETSWSKISIGREHTLAIMA
jgi:alpha-tubulin suppressor-like RCC1 family protein